MGDYRLNVDIKLTDINGYTKKIDWWVNWTPDRPEELYKHMVKVAKEAGLDVRDKSYLFDSD
jgi:hypothetical protein